MLLQSKDSFDEIAQLESEGGIPQFLSKRQLAKSARLQLQGSYSKIGDHLMALYVADGALKLRIDQSIFVINIGTRVELKAIDGKSNFLVFDSDKLLTQVEYPTPNIDPPLALDITPFVEQEDHDYGLFLYNVLASADRRTVFLESHQPEP